MQRKKLLIGVLAAALLIGTVSAALLGYYGYVSTTVNVTQSIKYRLAPDGGWCDYTEPISFTINVVAGMSEDMGQWFEVKNFAWVNVDVKFRVDGVPTGMTVKLIRDTTVELPQDPGYVTFTGGEVIGFKILVVTAPNLVPGTYALTLWILPA